MGKPGRWIPYIPPLPYNSSPAGWCRIFPPCPTTSPRWDRSYSGRLSVILARPFPPSGGFSSPPSPGEGFLAKRSPGQFPGCLRISCASGWVQTLRSGVSLSFQDNRRIIPFICLEPFPPLASMSAPQTSSTSGCRTWIRQGRKIMASPVTSSWGGVNRQSPLAVSF